MTFTTIRSAARVLLRSPRTSVSAIVCIALGTAAVSAVASLVVAALLRPLPFPEGDRLVRVWSVEEGRGDRSGVALADLPDLRELAAFDRVEAAVRARLIFVSDAGGRRVEGEGVTAGYFDLLGARLDRGRFFTPEEHAGAGAPVMLLTHEAWGRLFAFAESAVGAPVATPDAVYTVVGILDPSFTGSIEEDSGELEFFIPVSDGDAAAARTPGGAWTIARLAPEQGLALARDQVRALGARIAAAYPRDRAGTSLRLEAMSENWRGGIRRGLWLLLGAAGLLLVVAATNVAALMLAHGLSRRPEIALRAALGASRSRTITLLVREAALLTAIGGGVGIGLGPVLLRLFAGAATVPVPAYITLDADPLAIAIVVAFLAVTTLIAAVVPALSISDVAASSVIRGGGRGTSRGGGERRLQQGLIVTQVALATVLVSSTALLLRSYQSLNQADLGFRTEGMVRVALFVNALDAPEMSDVTALQERAVAALEEQPGVAGVGRVWPTAPLVAMPQAPIRYPTMDERDAETGELTSVLAADRAFFELLQIPLLAGRTVAPSDHGHAEPVVVVSRSLADRLGGPERAVGTVVTALGEERRVVGVVADARLTGPRAPGHEARLLFLPVAQFPNRTISFAIRSDGEDAATILPDVRRALARTAPASALDWTDSYDAALGEAFETDRFLIALTGLFSLATLALAGLGLLALLSYSVTRARFEIGVKQALGATRGRIVRGVVGRALGLAGAGVALGLVLSLAAARLLAGLLYQVDSLDPAALSATAAVLGFGALLASAFPARAAARVPPADVLRGP